MLNNFVITFNNYQLHILYMYIYNQLQFQTLIHKHSFNVNLLRICSVKNKFRKVYLAFYSYPSNRTIRHFHQRGNLKKVRDLPIR